MKRQRRQVRRYNFENINAQKVEEISMSSFYFPRTITLLAATLIANFFIVMSRKPESPEDNISAGLYMMVAFFFIISALAFPNGPFIRPHPVIWRLVFGVSVLYLLCLSFASCLNLSQIKIVLYWMDPNVRFAKREIDVVESYAVNCSSVSVERIYSTFDFFAFGHFVGWAVKALSLRSYAMCWSISILWEFTELFFMDIFPNFQECWWDQIILDIFLCNALGIWVGMKICKYLELRKYRWESIKDIHTTSGKLQRVVMQFTPALWTRSTWIGPGSSTRRILAVFGVLFLFLVSELNTFFLKHFFRFPATHPFCWVRLILVAIVAAPTCRQGYVYMTDNTCNRLGTQAWVFVAMMGLESIISIKIGYEEFTRTQTAKMVAWLLVTMVVTLASLFMLVNISKRRLQKEGKHVFDSADDSCWEAADKSD